VIPFEYARLAQIIHQERIQAAQARRPEWMYTDSPAAAPQRSGVTRRLRVVVAQALHRIAARFEPSAPAVTMRGGAQPTEGH